MLTANKIYTVSEILEEAGIENFDKTSFSLKNDISVGGIPCASLSAKIRVSNPKPLVVVAGRKQYKVEVIKE